MGKYHVNVWKYKGETTWASLKCFDSVAIHNQNCRYQKFFQNIYICLSYFRMSLEMIKLPFLYRNCVSCRCMTNSKFLLQKCFPLFLILILLKIPLIGNEYLLVLYEWVYRIPLIKTFPLSMKSQYVYSRTHQQHSKVLSNECLAEKKIN